jgi:hypothetical protein
MSVADLEVELARWRGSEAGPSNAQRLSIDEALAYRNAGNIPDAHERSLRLVLEIKDPSDLSRLDSKRLEFEPDYHEAPSWRRQGSLPVNVVPLRPPEVRGPASSPWWEQPELARLEDEWTVHGTVEGLSVPAEYRSFVYKTVLALKAGGRDVTLGSLLDSLARWMSPEDLGRLETALRRANPSP